MPKLKHIVRLIASGDRHEVEVDDDCCVFCSCACTLVQFDQKGQSVFIGIEEPEGYTHIHQIFFKGVINGRPKFQCEHVSELYAHMIIEKNKLRRKQKSMQVN